MQKRNRITDLIAVFVFVLFVGIGLGYAWAHKQTNETRVENHRSAEMFAALDEANEILKKEISVKEKMLAVLECESNFKYNAVGDNGASRGIAQFKKATFYEFADKAGLKYPNWLNASQQIYLLEWAIKNGYGEHWSCY